jgi:hypothetical protein
MWATDMDGENNGQKRSDNVREKGFRMGAVNLGTMNKKYGEVTEMLRRKLDCC